jgi:branched-chain amino acid transport system substrate-binding protein
MADKLTIGVILPLSGDFSDYGHNVLNGVKKAIADYEKKSGKKINLLIEDSFGDPLNCFQLAEKMLEASNPVCILGPLLSEEAVALGTLGKAYNVPIVSPTATQSGLATIAHTFFNVLYLRLMQRGS